MCVKCHGFDIYDEWSESKHGSIEPVTRCFDCHISGKAVADDPDNIRIGETIILEPGEKQGFHILGYHDGTGWVRLSPKEVCLRCHDGPTVSSVPPPCRFRNVRDCHQCHMPVDGLKTYRLHKWDPDNLPPINLDGINNNIVKYVTREHRSHKFVIPSRRDCD